MDLRIGPKTKTKEETKGSEWENGGCEPTGLWA